MRTRRSLGELTFGDIVAGRFTINELIEGLSPLAAGVCLVLGLAAIAGGVALLIDQSFTELLTRVLNIVGPLYIAILGLAGVIGGAGALLRRLRRSTVTPE